MAGHCTLLALCHMLKQTKTSMYPQSVHAMPQTASASLCRLLGEPSLLSKAFQFANVEIYISACCTLKPCCLLQVDEIITKMSRKGMTPSMIGVVLRDSHGVPQVGSVTGSKVLRILKKNGLAPEIPEDLYYMIKKAVVMRKHLEVNRKDKDGKFRLILVESRIHRLARYYKVRAHTTVHALIRLAGVVTSNLRQHVPLCHHLPGSTAL